jgi:hypothetical protein
MFIEKLNRPIANFIYEDPKGIETFRAWFGSMFKKRPDRFCKPVRSGKAYSAFIRPSQR